MFGTFRVLAGLFYSAMTGLMSSLRYFDLAEIFSGALMSGCDVIIFSLILLSTRGCLISLSSSENMYLTSFLSSRMSFDA